MGGFSACSGGGPVGAIEAATRGLAACGGPLGSAMAGRGPGTHTVAFAYPARDTKDHSPQVVGSDVQNTAPASGNQQINRLSVLRDSAWATLADVDRAMKSLPPTATEACRQQISGLRHRLTELDHAIADASSADETLARVRRVTAIYQGLLEAMTR